MDIFYAMDCLTERTSMLKGLEIQRKYLKGADKRIIGQYLHKLLKYNQKAFEFLGVKAAVEGLDLNSSLIFSSSNYIGCVPLRASDTGKQIGDFLVKPRYISHQQYHEYLEILNLLGNDISPEYLEGLSLRSGNALRPPRFLEAIKFIGILSELSSFSWQKFAVVEHQLPCPSGHVNWDKYSKLSGKPEKALIFPQNKNILTERHPEYAKLKYVFEICKKLVNSSNVPMQLKRTTYTKIGFLDKRLAHISIEATDLIPIKQSDKKSFKIVKNKRT